MLGWAFKGDSHRRPIGSGPAVELMVRSIAWWMRRLITLRRNRHIHELLEETCLNEHIVDGFLVLLVKLVLQQIAHVYIHRWVGHLANQTLN